MPPDIWGKDFEKLRVLGKDFWWCEALLEYLNYCHIYIGTYLGTLTFLINGEALINGEGGKFFKFNKRGGPNKQGGWNFFPNLIKGEG